MPTFLIWQVANLNASGTLRWEDTEGLRNIGLTPDEMTIGRQLRAEVAGSDPHLPNTATG